MREIKKASNANKGESKAKHHCLGALVRRMRRMALQTRLVIAFVTLIVCSASATIMIGTSVFGQKVDELGRMDVGLYMHLANQAFNIEMQQMRLATYALAMDAPDAKIPMMIGRDAFEGVHVDFAIRFDPGATVLFRKLKAHQSGSATFGRFEANGEQARVLREGPLASVISRLELETGPVVGLVVAEPSQLSMLGLPSLDEDLLVAVSAARGRRPGEVMLLGKLLNRNTEMLQRIKVLVNPRNPKEFGGTIFLGDRRIATVVKGSVLGTRADPRVSSAVLRGGRPYQGEASVVDRDFYASYTPLRDFDGNIVGMLGVGEGIGSEVYGEIRKATIQRFSMLIAGGMLFGFLMTFLFSSWLVRPVRELAAGMSRVAEGDFDHKVRIESADELGRLANAFNRMLRAVKERDNRLREMTDNRLNAAEKQISIGRLAAGVAHEINNPLTAVLSLSTLLRKKTREDDPDHEDLDIIVTETTRCRDIVRSLLDFARERPTEHRVVDINDVIHATMALVTRYDAMERIEVIVEPSPAPMSVNVDTKALQQVFTNLLENAAEATMPGGCIRITVDEDSSGGFVQIKLRDSGKGISDEDIRRVFEPFFTTKGERKGTGLGLSVSLGIVRKHDGSIEIESKEGEWTEVTVSLPRWDGD